MKFVCIPKVPFLGIQKVPKLEFWHAIWQPWLLHHEMVQNLNKASITVKRFQREPCELNLSMISNKMLKMISNKMLKMISNKMLKMISNKMLKMISNKMLKMISNKMLKMIANKMLKMISYKMLKMIPKKIS
jgi:Asp-tRNA(Asn)/Glu-tRNA(Gln) amidotransferase B subunit